MPEERIVFNDPEEARAWDMYVAGILACSEPYDAISIADAMLLERRKRMAPEKVEREWIKFEHGGHIPCDPYALVEFMTKNGAVFSAMKAFQVPWASDCADDYKIDAWRPA